MWYHILKLFEEGGAKWQRVLGGKMIEIRVIFATLAGSRLYGTAREDSDIDIRGVSLPPMEALLGLSPFEQHEVPGEDTVIYELRKFARLALKANPNILELLFAPEDAWQTIDDYGQQLIENRHLFLSRKVVHTYSGYAFAQLKRIEGHRRWLLEPPIEPIVSQFGGKMVGGLPVFPDQVAKDAYRRARREWQQYQAWVKNRNPARAKLEQRFGFDTKHGAHLVRLMLQAKAILTQPATFCPRLRGRDLEMVLAVRDGQWKYEALLKWAKDQEKVLLSLAEQSPLPKKPPFSQVERLIMKMLRRYVQEGIHV